MTLHFTTFIERDGIIEDKLRIQNIVRAQGRIPLRFYPDSLCGHAFSTANLLTTLSDGDVSGPGFELLPADSLNNYVEIETIDDDGLAGNFGVTLVLENPTAFPERSSLDTIRIECAEFEVGW